MLPAETCSLTVLHLPLLTLRWNMPGITPSQGEERTDAATDEATTIKAALLLLMAGAIIASVFQ